MKWIDLPPIWLAGHLVLVWLLRGNPDGALGPGLGAILVLAGIGLMVWAVAVMAAARTSVIPHTQPAALVTGGPFRLSRNPIYLGDAMVLAGASLWWGAWAGVILVAVFVWIITRRFIQPEEARLRAAFGSAFDDWAGSVRRWI